MHSLEIPIDFEKRHEGENKSIQIRLKRGKKEELEELGKTCKYMNIASTAVGTFADNAAALSSFDILGNFFVMINVAYNTIKGALDITSSAMDCDSVPFEEIKLLIEEKMNEVNRKLDEQTAVLKEVHTIVSKNFEAIEKMRLEMKEGFEKILKTIHDNEISNIVVKIDNFVQYFDNERARIRGDVKEQYIAKLEEPEGILDYLKRMRVPSSNSLNSALFQLMNEDKKYVIPKNINDENAFKALNALFYGTQAYVSIMFFLIKQYSYLAGYHYQAGNYEKFNENFQTTETTFKDFKFSLTGESNSVRGTLIDNVIKILNTVKQKKFIINHLERDFYHKIMNQIEILSNLKNKIETMSLPIIRAVPSNIIGISMKFSQIFTPIGSWVRQATVQYAIQYELNGKFSKLSNWSNKINIRSKANPNITLPNDPENRNRLIFRKFNNDKPQFIGIVRAKDNNFRDINRDLFNAALDVNKDTYNDVKILLENGANKNAKFDFGWNSLHAAAYAGHVNIAKEFLLGENPINISEPDDKGFTPLHVAAKFSKLGFVKFLVENGADVNAMTKKRLLSPLHISAHNGFENVVKYLLTNPKINVNQVAGFGYSPLHSSIAGGINVVNNLLQMPDIDVNARSKNGLTAFHLAVIKEDIAIAEALFKKQGNVNAGDIDNMTPLHYASIKGNMTIVSYLLSKKEININAVTLDNNWTPLYISIFFKNKDVALRLLNETNVNYYFPAIGNVTPSHLAVSTGQVGVVEELLNKEIHLEEKTEEGYTCLHLAAIHDEVEIASLFVAKGANLEARTANNYTPLHCSAYYGSTSTLMYFLYIGADMSAKTSNGSTALHLATAIQKLDIVEELLRKGANVKEYDDEGCLPIHNAIMKDDIKIVEAIIKYDPSLLENNSEEKRSIYESIRSKMMVDVHDYIVTSKHKTEDGNEIFQNLEKEGKFDIALLLFEDENPTHLLKCTFNFFLTKIRNCLSASDSNSPEINDIPISSDSPSLKKCYYQLPKKFMSMEDFIRTYAAATVPISIIPPAATLELKMMVLNKTSNYTLTSEKISYGISVREFCLHDENSGWTLEPSVSEKRMNYFKRAPVNPDINHSLLLLDVLVRKFTKVKFDTKDAKYYSDLKPLSDAEEKFATLLNYFENMPKNEKVDLTETHAYLQNMALVGDKNQMKVLCTFWETLSKLKSEETEELLGKYLSTEPRINPPTNSAYKQLPQLLTTTCLSERI